MKKTILGLLILLSGCANNAIMENTLADGTVIRAKLVASE